MKKLLFSLGLLAGFLLAVFGVAQAVTILSVPQGGTGTNSLGTNMLIVSGTTITGALTASSSPTAARYFATSTLPSVLPYASSTAISILGSASTTQLVVSNSGGTAGCATFSVDGTISNTGVACGTGSAGVFNPFTNPTATSFATTSGIVINNASSTIIGNLNIIGDATTTNATTTSLSLSNLWINSEVFTDLTGTGLSNSAGVLTNSGVTSIVAGTNITISGATGAVTITALPFPFTNNPATGATSFYGQSSESTTTQIHFGGAPFSLTASSTAVFVSATTTGLTVTNQWFTGLTSGELAVDTAGLVYKGATTTFTGTAPITLSYAPATGVVTGSCAVATASVAGCLAAADFTIFTNKLGSYDDWTHPAAAQSATTSSLFITPANTTLSVATTTPWGMFSLHALASSTSKILFAIGSTTNTGGTSMATSTLFSIDNTGAHIIYSSSTQMTLRDNILSDFGWSFKAINNNLYISTSTNTGATSTIPAWTILSNDNIGVSTSSPFAELSIHQNPTEAANTNLFNIGSSTQTATTTLFNVLNSGYTGIGTTSPYALFSIFAASSTSNVNPTVLFAIGSSTSAGVASNLFSVSNTGLASSTNLVVSGAGGVGTRCAQFATDGTISAAASACGSASGMSAYDAWTHLVAATPNSATSSTILLTATSSFLGIGTSTPWANFSIHNLASSTQTTLFAIGSTTNTSGSTMATSTLLSISNTGNLLLGTTTNNVAGSVFAQVISNSIQSFGGLLINTWTNVTNAFSIKGSDGVTRFNVDTTVNSPAFVVGTTSPIAQLSSISTFGSYPLNNWLFQLASSSQGATTTVFAVNDAGHIIASSTSVVAGTNASSVFGNDTVGSTTVANGAIGVVYIRFARQWRSVPQCFANLNSATSTLGIAGTSTTLTVISTTTTNIAFVASAQQIGGSQISWFCLGAQDGTHF